MNISILYHSESGNTEKIGKIIAQGAEKVEGICTKCMNINDVDEDFINQSKAVIFGTPTYYGTYSWQMKKWLDTSKIKLADKVGSVFATENFLGGGADTAEMAVIGELLVKGMLIYSAGCAQGQPFTHFGCVNIKDGDEFQRQRAEAFGERVAKKVNELFG